MIWNDLKIRTKIGLGFSFILFLLVVMGIITLTNMQRIDSKSIALANNYIPSTSNSSKLDRYWHEMIFYMQTYGYSYHEYYFEKGKQRINNVNLVLDNLIKLTNDNEELKSANSKFTQIKQSLETFNNLLNSYHESAIEYKKNHALARNIISNTENSLSLNNQSLYIANESFIQILNENPKKLYPINAQISNLLLNPVNQEMTEYLNNIKNQNISFIDLKSQELKRIEMSNNILSEIMSLSELGLDKILEMGDENNQITHNARNVLIFTILIISIIALKPFQIHFKVNQKQC